MDERHRAFADCIGVVNNKFLDNDPAVVGASYLQASAEYDFGVRFLVKTELDAAQATQSDLPSLLEQSMEREMEARGLTGAASRLYVTLSSLEAQGIKR